VPSTTVSTTWSRLSDDQTVDDLDGVVLRHNGYLNGADELLPEWRGLWTQIGADDLVIVPTARPEREPQCALSSTTRCGD
jgi:hypothetical protein